MECTGKLVCKYKNGVANSTSIPWLHVVTILQALHDETKESLYKQSVLSYHLQE